MPRPGPRRPAVTVRLDPPQRVWLEEEAVRRGVSQGEIVRALLAREMEAKGGRDEALEQVAAYCESRHLIAALPAAAGAWREAGFYALQVKVGEV